MRVGTDGSVTAPDPDVIVSFDADEVEEVIELLMVALAAARVAGNDAVGRRLAGLLVKFQRIRASQELED